jgi:hypothetical protein
MASTKHLYDQLKPGDRIRVAFGRSGAQTAIVKGRGTFGVVNIRRFIASTRKWGPTVALNWRDLLALEERP